MEDFEIGEEIDLSDFIWSSDWCGDELGYDYIEVVGHYTRDILNVYVDMIDLLLLEYWYDEED